MFFKGEQIITSKDIACKELSLDFAKMPSKINLPICFVFPEVTGRKNLQDGLFKKTMFFQILISMRRMRYALCHNDVK